MAVLSAEDIEKLEEAADAYVEAMNAGDWTRVAGSFSEDAVRYRRTRTHTRVAQRSRRGSVESRS